MRELAVAWSSLNIADAVGTWWGVSRGYAYEANPIMAWAISCGFFTFFALKVLLGLAVIALLLLGSYERPIIVKRTLIGCIGIYSLLLAVHVYGFVQHARGVV